MHELNGSYSGVVGVSSISECRLNAVRRVETWFRAKNENLTDFGNMTTSGELFDMNHL